MSKKLKAKRPKMMKSAALDIEMKKSEQLAKLKCYYEGCGKEGIAKCNIYILLSKNLGCGRSLCEEHCSKRRCWLGANNNGWKNKVCSNCEKDVMKRLKR